VSIDKPDFDSVNEQDLQELVDSQVPEGVRVEYKLKNYGNSDSDKRELLKDVSAFANSHGGHLIIGVRESEGAAAELTGVDIDADAELLRMEQMVRNAIEPSISGIRMRAVPLSNGNKVLLLRIPRSWNPPHRVTAQGKNKFFLRHSAGVHEPSIEELRALFNQSAVALEKARQFRDDRIEAAIRGEGQRPLEDGGRLFFHIVSTAAFSGMINLDVEAIHQKYQNFWPLGASGMSPRFNFHGFINERGGDKNHGYTQIFRVGALEATMAGIAREHEGKKVIPGLSVEEYIFKNLPIYINGLKELGVPTPLVVMFTLEGVSGAKYAVLSRRFFDEDAPLTDHMLRLPGCIVEEYGSDLDYHKAVRPAFDTLWNAIGFARSQFFDEEGRWVGDR
jgi:hypothetical protein